MRRFAALITSLMLAGCVTGIPDADSSIRVPKAEPCEVWVTIEPEHVRQCMSRDRWERESGIPAGW